MAGTPTRRAAPVTEPAEVPTMTLAQAGIPADLALERGEDAGLVRLPDDAARAQDQADGRQRLRC